MHVKRLPIHILLATTLFAAVVWTSVNLGFTYQVSRTVPLAITGVPPGMAMKAPVPQQLRLRLRGEGWRLAALMFGPDPRCLVDLGSLPPGSPAITLPDVVERLNLPAGVTATDVNPDSILIAVDSVGTRRVPVVLDQHVTFRDRYGPVGPTLVTPESVLVEGARSVLDMVVAWKTHPLMLENVKAPVDRDVPLLPSDRYLLTVSPSEVRVQIDVQWYAEKELMGIPVEVHSVPPHREVILVPPRIDLVVRGGVEQLAHLTAADVVAEIDYAVILTDTTGLLAPTLHCPPWLQVVSRRPGQLQYVVRKRL